MARLRDDIPIKLDLDQYLELTCGQGIGPNYPDDIQPPKTEPFDRDRSVFESEEQRRRTWEVHRERLLANSPPHSEGPWAHLRYDGGDLR
jgi:hypothetical protein